MNRGRDASSLSVAWVDTRKFQLAPIVLRYLFFLFNYRTDLQFSLQSRGKSRDFSLCVDGPSQRETKEGDRGLNFFRDEFIEDGKV